MLPLCTVYKTWWIELKISWNILGNKCKLITKAYLDKAIINVKHPKTSVTKAKIGKVIEANCKRWSLKNTNNVVEKNMIKLLKMAKIEDNIRTQIKDEVDLDMMVIK